MKTNRPLKAMPEIGSKQSLIHSPMQIPQRPWGSRASALLRIRQANRFDRWLHQDFEVWAQEASPSDDDVSVAFELVRKIRLHGPSEDAARIAWFLLLLTSLCITRDGSTAWLFSNSLVSGSFLENSVREPAESKRSRKKVLASWRPDGFHWPQVSAEVDAELARIAASWSERSSLSLDFEPDFDQATLFEGSSDATTKAVQTNVQSVTEASAEAWMLEEHEVCLEEARSCFLVRSKTSQGFLLSIARLFALEKSIAENLRERQRFAKTYAHSPAAQSPLHESMKSFFARLSSEQEQAVSLSLKGPCTIVTGGPGTGKTFVAQSILVHYFLERFAAFEDTNEEVLLARVASEIALLAPTGKAADRLNESIRSRPSDSTLNEATEQWLERALSVVPKAKTLHRFLGFDPHQRTFRTSESERRSLRLVLIDEASMLDVSLMEKILQTLPRQVRLVCLGDPNQLPSIDPGAVLFDLLKDGARANPHVGVARLTQTFRRQTSDASLATNSSLTTNSSHRDPWDFAAAMVEQKERGEEIALALFPRAADASVVALHSTSSTDFDRDRFVLLPLEDEDYPNFFERWWQRFFAPLHQRGASLSDLSSGSLSGLRELLDLLDVQKILTLLRQGRDYASADAINAWFRTRSLQAGHLQQNGFGAFEPVMVSQNDYQRSLWNGDQGIVIPHSHQQSSGWSVAFRSSTQPQGVQLYPLHLIASILEPTYATTVHKAQGSEYREIGIVLPSEANALLSLEMVYTGITRAKFRVYCVGKESILRESLRHSVRRTTRLSQLLCEE